MDRVQSRHELNQKMWSFSKQLSARTPQRCLQQHIQILLVFTLKLIFSKEGCEVFTVAIPKRLVIYRLFTVI